MKSQVFACALALVSIVAGDQLDLKTMEKYAQNFKECQKESGFVGSLGDINAESPQKAKCFLKCLFMKHNAIKKDGSIDKDTTKELVSNLPMVAEIPGIKEKSDVIVEECASEVIPDPNDLCETAHKYFICHWSKAFPK